MALRPCLTPGCGQLTPSGHCPAHTKARAKARDQRRGTAAQRGYDHRHRSLVADAIRAHPWCADCGLDSDRAKTIGNPLTGHHLRWPALTTADLMVLCRRCNSTRGPVRYLGGTPPT